MHSKRSNPSTAAAPASSSTKQLRLPPDALLVSIMDFLRGDFKSWASLLGTCRYVHNHHVDNLVELKILWEKAQRKRALYNCYFYSTSDLHGNNIGAEGAKYVAEALKVNTSLTEINLRSNFIVVVLFLVGLFLLF